MEEVKMIALDCDDVLTDYNSRWGELYAEFFEVDNFIPKNKKAHYATDYWGVNWINREKERNAFEHFFHEKGWSSMKALDGAVEATKILKEMDYSIFVVTRMPKSGQDFRTQNLKELGFSFDAVIGTGHSHNELHNPKKEYIEALEPQYFVDDLMDNFHGINSRTKFVWLDLERDPTPNHHLFKDIPLHDTHPNLLSFVKSISN